MDDDRELRQTFYGILAFDASDAIGRMEAHDSQSTRRDFVRTAFAAIEGWLWDYRQSVRSTIGSIRDLSPLEEAAFSETSYSIGDNGKLREQTRFVAMTTMFRFVTRIAEEECGKELVDFASADWQNFSQAMAIRNRVTHPKNIEDLKLSDVDIESVKESLLWFFEMCVTVREQMPLILKDHLQSMRDVGAALAAGDLPTLKLYGSVLENTNK